MEDISTKQYRTLLLEGLHREYTSKEKKTLNNYRFQANNSIKKGRVVSGLVALTLVGSLFVADALTPKEVKNERKAKIEKIAKEMPYGFR